KTPTIFWGYPSALGKNSPWHHACSDNSRQFGRKNLCHRITWFVRIPHRTEQSGGSLIDRNRKEKFMADEHLSTSGVKPTLGLTGVTVNAMALIAPGAFLWITFQLQAAATAPSGASVANDMWPGIVAALILAFLTAISYAELAKIYPEAGFGSCYYFAEKAFLDREEKTHHKWARLAKIVTGWAAHLFYWVYPGVMVAFMATLI